LAIAVPFDAGHEQNAEDTFATRGRHSRDARELGQAPADSARVHEAPLRPMDAGEIAAQARELTFGLLAPPRAQIGPQNLRTIKSFHDEALSGNLRSYRSSRLSIHYRVIYQIDRDQVTVDVEKVTNHGYRK
jgi:hypothetical protein